MESIGHMFASIARKTGMLKEKESHRGGGRRLESLGDNAGCYVDTAEPEKKRQKLFAYQVCYNEMNKDHINRILSWLSDVETTIIGIHGMGGIGKTALANQLYCQIGSHKILSLSSVAWIHVGKCCTTFQLQQEISCKIGFSFKDDKNEIRRAANLHAQLLQKGKFVLILDDLWDDFRLENAGIPQNCHLVLTSRSLDVLRKMRCQKVVKIEPLLPDDAWRLFCDTIECGTMLTADVSHIAQRVCEECAGVPLAITAVGKRMRRKTDVYSWNDMLHSMSKYSAESHNLKHVFDDLKVSYSSLTDAKVQLCFLYITLYPEDYSMSREEIIHLWIGDILADDMKSLQPQYDKGHSILNKLLNSSLLETSKHRNWVKMHDLIHDMAISISKERFMVRAGEQLREIPAESEWQKDLQAVSLMKNNISEIPSGVSPECPDLSTLLLQHNPIQKIPESFFLNMPTLRVLNLSHTRIESLPNSMSNLEELRLLDLSSCQSLTHLPSLRKLQKLRFLDISHTAVEQVPHHLGMLKMLGELNLFCIPAVESFWRDALPALSQLRRLSCNIVGTIPELQGLQSLEILDARFLHIGDLNSYVRSQHWRLLEGFHLQVGHNLRVNRVCSRVVSLGECSVNVQERVLLPDKIEELYIDDCRGFSCLSEVISILHPWREQQFYKKTNEAFPSLEICSISRCRDVETLFRPGWVKNLQQLTVLEIEDCANLKEIISEEVGNDSYYRSNHAVMLLPQLKQLVLNLLPRLHRIYKGIVASVLLRSLRILGCPKLNRLPFSFCGNDPRRLVLPDLEQIEAQEEWWEMLDWDHPEAKVLLIPFLRRKVSATVIRGANFSIC